MNFTSLNPGTPRSSGLYQTTQSGTIEIRDVWASNVDEEMAKIREVIHKYPYIAMVQYLLILVLFCVFCVYTVPSVV